MEEQRAMRLHPGIAQSRKSERVGGREGHRAICFGEMCEEKKKPVTITKKKPVTISNHIIRGLFSSSMCPSSHLLNQDISIRCRIAVKILHLMYCSGY